MNAIPTPASFRDKALLSKTLTLRRFTASDIEGRYQKWLSDYEVTKHLNVAFKNKSNAALREFVQSVQSSANRLFYMIVIRETGESIGTASLEIDPIHRLGNYGYMIGERQWWGKSIAIEAQVALFDLAFDHLGVTRFYGGARMGNIASQFNLKRLGFRKEGVFRKHVRRIPDSDEYVDVVFYGLLREEWYSICKKFDSCRYGGLEDL